MEIKPIAVLDFIRGISLPEGKTAILAATDSILPNRQHSTMCILKGKVLDDTDETVRLNAALDMHEPAEHLSVLLDNGIDNPDFLLLSDIDIEGRLRQKNNVIRIGHEPSEVVPIAERLERKTSYLDADIFEIVEDVKEGRLIHVLQYFFRSDDGIHRIEYCWCYLPLDQCEQEDIDNAESDAKQYEEDGLTDEQANEAYDKLEVAGCLAMHKVAESEYKTDTPYLSR